MNYFHIIPEARINKPAILGRFMFLDRYGKTAVKGDTGASDKPLGVYYLEGELASSISYGQAKYYQYGYPNPIYLELTSGVTQGGYIDSDDDGKGIPANRDGDTLEGYAMATENGEDGEIIHVLVQYVKKPVKHAFSSAFNYYHFK